jgi:hypothetical protein
MTQERVGQVVSISDLLDSALGGCNDLLEVWDQSSTAFLADRPALHALTFTADAVQATMAAWLPVRLPTVATERHPLEAAVA